MTKNVNKLIAYKKQKINDILVHPPDVLSNIFKGTVWSKESSEKSIFLTFDDGPVPDLTENVLDVLDQYNAKASFFCVGENVSKFGDIYNEVNHRGHLTGNHTFSHLNGWKTCGKSYLKDIEKADILINSNYFRPPYGKINPLASSEISAKYKIIMWDVLSQDYDKRKSGPECFENIKRFAKNGSIIVFHDNYKAKVNMLYSLQKTLDFYNESGYKFERIDFKDAF